MSVPSKPGNYVIDPDLLPTNLVPRARDFQQRLADFNGIQGNILLTLLMDELLLPMTPGMKKKEKIIKIYKKFRELKLERDIRNRQQELERDIRNLRDEVRNEFAAIDREEQLAGGIVYPTVQKPGTSGKKGGGM